MWFLSLLTILASTVVAQQHNTSPYVVGSGGRGWKSFPEVIDATAYPEWFLNETIGAYIPAYQTTGLDTKNVKRAVIVLHGRARRCWHDWTAANNALYQAAYDDHTIKREEISILAPCFFDENDLKAGAARQGQLLWPTTRTWMGGHRNVGPISISNYSSFDALDTLVGYYMDKNLYPNLKVVVVAGHSAGGQMSQRYAALRKSTENDDRLHFWIANPGSLLWLTTDRPFPDGTCDYDRYKFGLASGFPRYATDALVLGREGIIERYKGRKVSYAWGLNDHGNTDRRCPAMTQGSTHVQRGKKFVAMLEHMGDIPKLTTVDWIPSVGHSTERMMSSDVGIDKLFRHTETGSGASTGD
ncbi:uncharacterized protein BT62DRAFT_1071005 [Guyanagaster necrorhizus]|uniref:Alpha/beta hydrolase n=1 Tax=Guyanagaster necrorhizus TaxID=856835 RepID=A0A9P7W461_9AGAR|nr:uncharacterized protein BT62DRAFT_1071005 [Guyanagaster necrorhizus MCA 3950]KAG7451784.1 hypothetical protein BT62DRAFT_1071005 [Guyanagaster necrorhizus MCA 3950]